MLPVSLDLARIDRVSRSRGYDCAARAESRCPMQSAYCFVRSEITGNHSSAYTFIWEFGTIYLYRLGNVDAHLEVPLRGRLAPTTVARWRNHGIGQYGMATFTNAVEMRLELTFHFDVANDCDVLREARKAWIRVSMRLVITDPFSDFL